MDLYGKKIGLWSVLSDKIETPSGTKYLCRCDCGTERYVLAHSLKYGGSKSCGCVTRKKASEASAHKLEGKTFSDLKVLHVAENQRKNGGVWWTCQCSCGTICDVSASLLVTGRKTHCGCKTPPKNYYYVDISGKKFNHITALYPIKKGNKKGNMIWKCQCDCGNQFEASYNELVYTNLQSCGCQKKIHNEKLRSFLTHVNGTSVDSLRSKKIPTDNTTGVKGVYFIKGKWVAKIVFQKKQYLLGKYDTLQEAAEVRQEAEHILFDGAVAHYEKWKQMADEDPEWAKENPVEIIVEKKNGSELNVTFLPVIKEKVKRNYLVGSICEGC